MKYILQENIRSKFEKSQRRLKDEQIIERIWQKDHTVWSDRPDEIANRLGWLESVESTERSLDEINSFVKEVIAEGFEKVILMGMGGSSLAPEVFRKIFGVKEGFLDLAVVDSTHPDFISEVTAGIDFNKTLFFVSTKSGGTVETISFMKYFYHKTVSELGMNDVGKHFAAITDPGSGLEKIAQELTFRKIFLNDPNIGGRYSALSLFGMVPAALVGVDLNHVLFRTKSIIDSCKTNDQNPAVELGLIMGISALKGLEKVTFLSSPQLKPFGAWIEQLIAESTGKDGKGILPIDLEEIISTEEYSMDRIFIYIKLQNENTYDNVANQLTDAGFNLITIELENIYDLGVEFFRWEFATTIAGWKLEIQPFDQPNVESAKVVAKQIMADYREKGNLAITEPSFLENTIKVYSDLKSIKLKDSLIEFFSKIVKDKSYVAIQAYLKPSNEADNLLRAFRTAIQKKYNVATTLGFGPRFLHSTGQLHKGDAGNGLFIQIVDEPLYHITIPENPEDDESTVSFNILIKAQAFGDRKALLDNNRTVITFNVGKDVKGGIEKLIRVIDN